MLKFKALDLFCCAGGASMGLHMAGFDVTGVDIQDQPNYPFRFIKANALEFDVSEFDFIWASPPCQAFTLAKRIRKNNHPNLIPKMRKILQTSGKPFVIENVVGAPLINPVLLCGAMFENLKVYRHRIFETNFAVEVPPHPKHVASLAKMGRTPKADQFMHVVGNFSGVEQARRAMGMTWANRNEMSQAIPPAYSKFLAQQWMRSNAVVHFGTPPVSNSFGPYPYR